MPALMSRRRMLDMTGRAAAGAIGFSAAARGTESAPDGPELLILAPENESLAWRMAARMVEQGVWFSFEDPSRLPVELPAALDSYRMIVLPAERANDLEGRLAPFRHRGGLVATADESQWKNERFVERIALRGGLTLRHPGMARRMEQVGDRQILHQCLRWAMDFRDGQWSDVPRYYLEVLLGAYRVTREKAILDRAGRLVDELLETRPAHLTDNAQLSCFYPMLEYAELAGRRQLVPLCVEAVDEYLRQAPRCRGVVSNFAAEGGVVRAETAFNLCNTLARLGRVASQPRYVQTAVEQLLLIDQDLADPRTGLWYVGRGMAAPAALLWGRGCAFSLLAVIETLLELPDLHQDRPRLTAIARRMAEAFMRFQDAEGRWHQVLDEPVRPEPTATAWTTAALAKMLRHGLLEPRFQVAVDAGWRAVKRQTWDGRPVAICMATTASADPDYYRFLLFARPSPYAHFPLLAANEVLLLDGDRAN